MNRHAIILGVLLSVGLVSAPLIYSDPVSEDNSVSETVEVLRSTSAETVNGQGKSPVESSTRTLPIPLPSINQTAFAPGERLEFVIKYEFVVGGEASLVVENGPNFKGKPTYNIVSRAKSNSFIDVFFKVRDFNSSMIYQDSLATISFHQNLREGHYKVVRNTKVDYETGTFEYERQYKGRTTNRTGEVLRAASDILSSFYYLRALPIELGGTYYIDVFSDQDYYKLRVDVEKQLDTVKVPAGKFECFVVRPQVVGDAIFKAKEGKMTIWITNDQRKMPVLIRSKVLVGSFDAELREFTLPKK